MGKYNSEVAILLERLISRTQGQLHDHFIVVKRVKYHKLWFSITKHKVTSY